MKKNKQGKAGKGDKNSRVQDASQVDNKKSAEEKIPDVAAAVEVKPRKKMGGKLQRKEPNSVVEFVAFPETEEKFKTAGWLGFLHCLKGYHTEVAMAFAKSFDGYEAKIGELTLFVSEYSIAELAGMELGGKRITKKGPIDEVAANSFLKPEFQNPNWKNGIPTKWLKNEYQALLQIVKTFITCDGRYGHMFRYQVWFLRHLNGEIKVNLPHFLLQSLTKMSKKVQKYPNSADSSLIHQSLITMLLCKALEGENILVYDFLAMSGFSIETPSKQKRKQSGECSKINNEEEAKEIKENVKGQRGKRVKMEKPEIKLTSERRVTRARQAQELTSGVEKHIPDKEKKKQDDESEKQGKMQTKARQTRAANKYQLRMKMLSDSKVRKEDVILIDEDTVVSSDPKEKISSNQGKSKKRKGVKKMTCKKSVQANVKTKRGPSGDVTFETDHEALIFPEDTSIVVQDIQKTPKQKMINSDQKKRDKGKTVVLIEDLEEELQQVSSEERKLSQKRILKQKARRWLDAIANEDGQSKPKEEKIKVMCESFVDLGKLAKELIETVDKATSPQEDQLAQLKQKFRDEGKEM